MCYCSIFHLYRYLCYSIAAFELYRFILIASCQANHWVSWLICFDPTSGLSYIALSLHAGAALLEELRWKIGMTLEDVGSELLEYALKVEQITLQRAYRKLLRESRRRVARLRRILEYKVKLGMLLQCGCNEALRL